MATYLRDLTETVYVTLRAAEEYAGFRGLQIEEARRELTELLMGARPIGESQGGAEQWRVRSRPVGVDVTAHVSREGELAVIVHTHTRGR